MSYDQNAADLLTELNAARGRVAQAQAKLAAVEKVVRDARDMGCKTIPAAMVEEALGMVRHD